MNEEPKFELNERYCQLLLDNQEFHKRVRMGKARYDTLEFDLMKEELTKIERAMSSTDIIKHAEYLFPQVHNEK